MDSETWRLEALAAALETPDLAERCRQLAALIRVWRESGWPPEEDARAISEERLARAVGPVLARRLTAEKE